MICLRERPLRGGRFRAGNVAEGSAALVRDHRIQPFGSEIVAIVGRHARTTAAAITAFLGGVGEGQVPR